MYYRGAAAAVVVFDITHPSSFDRAKKWVGELRQNVQNAGLVIALVGNKVDLAEGRQVPEADARGYAGGGVGDGGWGVGGAVLPCWV